MINYSIGLCGTFDDLFEYPFVELSPPLPVRPPPKTSLGLAPLLELF